jgi:hypothetical protein
MDDRQRLLRLVSLVAWAGEPGSNACGLRFASAEDEQQWHGPTATWVARLQRGEVTPEPESGDAHAALWRLTSWYAGTVWNGNDPATGDLDTREFPGVAKDPRQCGGVPTDRSITVAVSSRPTQLDQPCYPTKQPHSPNRGRFKVRDQSTDDRIFTLPTVITIARTGKSW